MSNTLDTYKQQDLFITCKKWLANEIVNGKGIACWSLPKENHFHLMSSKEVIPLNDEIVVENLGKGFLISPFDNTKHETFFLKSDEYWNSTHDLNDLSTEFEISEDLQYWGPGKPIQTDPENYKSMVDESVGQIAAGNFEKVVPARASTTRIDDNFDIFNFFLTLKEQHPDAFVSWYFLPGVGSWIGASPELLIEIQDTTFKTVALAGTQPYDPSHSIKETTWTQKEIEEQALVSRYIINCFKKIRLREFEEHGPKTVRAGNLLHLKTDFEVDIKETNFADLGSVMLKLLHPTSAVCGMPLKESREFLAQHEGFDRRYYAGFLGPVSVNDSTNIFVNLRCLQLIKGHAISYAGAGVTIDSDPVKELNETEIKMSTLIRWLK